MDSRLAYAVVNRSTIDWQKDLNNNEWIHVNTFDQIYKEKFTSILNQEFEKETLWLILGRNNSKKIHRDNLLSEIINEKIESFKLSNESFTKFMEFSIGVLRIGKKP